jgi:hypothetical protein
MRRLTSRIGLFGGPGSLMPTMGVNKKPGRGTSEVPIPEPRPEASPSDSEISTGAPKKKSWLRRLFG